MIKICGNLATEGSRTADKVFHLSENLFLEVRDYVYASQAEDGTCFRVFDAKGKFLFWVQYAENLVLGEKRTDFFDYEKRFLESERLDFSLLDQYRVFVFTEVEEYSIAIEIGRAHV